MTYHTARKDWTTADIAALSSRDIARLNYDEMKELVQSSQGASVANVTESDVLVRRVYALQRRCKIQIAAS